MSSFTPSGVEFVARNLNGYLSDLTKADRGQQNLGRSISNLGASFTRIGSTALKVSGLIAGIGFVGLATGLGAVVKTGLSFNNTMEQARAKINAFTKDADLTTEILENVRLEAAKTPFEFDAMANAVSGLLPAARQADVAIMDLLRDAEVLAASRPEEGLEGAAFALREAVSGDFTSVIERFNLPRTMINELKAQGLPALEIVRTAMNNLGYDMDLVSALAATAEGRWSTLKDTFTNLAGTVTKPIFDTLSSSLGGINDLLTANAPQMQAFADLLAGKVAGAITVITAKATELMAAFAAGGAGGLLAALGIGPDGVALFEKVSTLITDVSTAISTTLLPILTDLATGGVMDTINSVLTFINDHFEEFLGAIIAIGAVVGAGVLIALGTAIAGLVTPVTLLMAGAALLGAAWAGNWFGIQDAVFAAWAVIQPILSDLWAWLSTNIPIAVQAASDVWTTTLQPALIQVGAWINDTLIPALTTMRDWLQTNIPVAVQAASDIWTTALLPSLTTVGVFITDTLIPAFTTMQTWLKDNIPPAIKTLSDIWTNTLLPALKTGYDNFSDMVMLFQSIGEVINAVLNLALKAMAGIWQNILLPALTKVGNFLRDHILAVFKDVSKTVGDDVSPALKDFGEFVMPLVEKGINFVSDAIERMTNLFKGMADAVNNFTLPDILTPGSPPPMANALTDIAAGANLAGLSIARMQQNMMSGAGAADNFIDSLNMGGFAARGMLSNWNDVRDIIHQNIRPNMAGLASGAIGGDDITRIIGGQALAWNVPPGMLQGIAQAQGLVGHFTDTFAAFREQMRIEAMDKMTETASQLVGLGSNFANRIQTAMEAKTGKGSMFEALKKFLAGTEEAFSFTEMLDPSTGAASATWMYDRNRAQEEYNELLAEQRAQQEQLAKIAQQQADLAFLQDQLGILKMIREAGLSVGEVFGDNFEFGLGASAEGMLAGISNLVGLMVGQINEDLQIASPSKVMARIGERITQGLAVGVDRGGRLLEYAFNASVSPFLDMGRRVAAPLASTYNNSITNNFDMKVSTGANPAAVIRQYEVARSMV